MVLAWYHKGLVPHGHGQPVEVTNGGHQCGSTNGPTSESHQWRSSMGGTSGGLPIGLPVGVTNGGHQWGSPVGVTSGCHQRGVYQWAYQWGSPVGVYQWAYQWGSTLSRCWYALLAVRCLSLQRDAERFRKSSPRLSHYRLLAAPAAVSAPWRPHAPHMRLMLVDSGRRSQSK